YFQSNWNHYAHWISDEKRDLDCGVCQSASRRRHAKTGSHIESRRIAIATHFDDKSDDCLGRIAHCPIAWGSIHKPYWDGSCDHRWHYVFTCFDTVRHSIHLYDMVS